MATIETGDAFIGCFWPLHPPSSAAQTSHVSSGLVYSNSVVHATTSTLQLELHPTVTLSVGTGTVRDGVSEIGVCGVARLILEPGGEISRSPAHDFTRRGEIGPTFFAAGSSPPPAA